MEVKVRKIKALVEKADKEKSKEIEESIIYRTLHLINFTGSNFRKFHKLVFDRENFTEHCAI